MTSMIRLGLGFRGSLLLTIAFLVSSPPAESHSVRRAAVRWASDIEATLQPGDTHVFPVTLTATQNLPELSIFVGPRIRPLVTASPSVVGPLKRGQSVTVTVSISVPTDALPCSQEGLIVLGLPVQPRKPIVVPLPKPLHVAIDVVWPTQSDTSGAYALSYPPNWNLTRSPGGDRASLSNVPQLSDDWQNETYFEITQHVGVKSADMPIDVWFQRYFSRGFPSEPQSVEVIPFADRTAVRIRTSEPGGTHVHIYLPDERDVIELTYRGFTPQFTPYYERIVEDFRVLP